VWLWSASTPLRAQRHQVVDVQSVRIDGDPSQWIHDIEIPAEPEAIACDILVAGAGPGGVAAALRAAERGHTVCLSEETDWIGGQLGTVSALDENRFIEFAGGTRAYYDLRRRIRALARSEYSWKPGATALENFNPGACYVSPLCYEPKFAIQAVREILEPFSQRIRIMPRTVVFELIVDGGEIRTAYLYNFETKQVSRIRPLFVLDATELGDLLPLAGVPYVAGSEARANTGEPHASEAANPACVQSFTYTFIAEHRPGEEHRIPQPPGYEKYRDGQPFSMLLNYPEEYGWKGNVQYVMFGEDPAIPNNQTPRPFFSWRRVRARKNLAGPNPPTDLALINWPRQDYKDQSLLDKAPLEMAAILQQAKRVSYAFLYWLQTDVPHEEGVGKGYPEIALHAASMESPDGLSKYPYIRESRRIRGQQRVVEQDIVAEYQSGSRAKWFADSVGTGFYMVDIHPCGANERGRMMMPRPFQIPMGALIPSGVGNLLASAKNIGVTHLTNGAYRLHPVEWNIGEAAATFAAMTIETGHRPQPAEVQHELLRAGVPLVWFDDLPVDDPWFETIQTAAIRGIYPLSNADLHAAPEAMLTRGEAARALAAYLGRDVSGAGAGRIDVPASHPHARAIDSAIEEGWMLVDHRNWFHPDIPFYWPDWIEEKLPRRLPPLDAQRTGPAKRSEMAERMTGSIE
jgi:hypothetical protein